MIMNKIELNSDFFLSIMWNEKRKYSKAEVWIAFLKEADTPLRYDIDGEINVEVGHGKFYTTVKGLAYSFGWTTPQMKKYIDSLVTHGIITYEHIRRNNAILIDIKQISDKYKKNCFESYNINTEDFLKEPTPTTANKPKYRRKEKMVHTSKEPILDFGKYKGLRISKCKDLQYLKWIYRNVDFDDFVLYAVEMQIDKLECN